MTMTADVVQARLAEMQSRFVGPGRVSNGGVLGGAERAKAEEADKFADALKEASGESGRRSETGSIRTTSSTADAVIAEAKTHLGKDYVWGGESDEEGGFDCSGLLQTVFKEFGIKLPRVSRDQAKVGEEVESLAEAKPGDLIAFNSPVSHIALYLGDGKILHAPKRGEVVQIDDIGNRNINTIRRVIPEDTLNRSGVDRLAFSGGSLTSNASALVNSEIKVPAELAQLFVDAGERHGVDPMLLASVSRNESNFRLDAKSRAGALGLMQFMPATARAMEVDPMNPASAVDGAARLLRGQKERFGSWDLAVAAYNAGGPAVKRHGGIPPFAETRKYVERVMSLWETARS